MLQDKRGAFGLALALVSDEEGEGDSNQSMSLRWREVPCPFIVAPAVNRVTDMDQRDGPKHRCAVKGITSIRTESVGVLGEHVAYCRTVRPLCRGEYGERPGCRGEKVYVPFSPVVDNTSSTTPSAFLLLLVTLFQGSLCQEISDNLSNPSPSAFEPQSLADSLILFVSSSDFEGCIERG